MYLLRLVAVALLVSMCNIDDGVFVVRSVGRVVLVVLFLLLFLLYDFGFTDFALFCVF